MTHDITHHLDDTVLRAYAAGTLSEAFGLVVACHISVCDDCRAALAACEAVGGALLDRAAPAPLAAHSYESTLAAIRGAKAAPVPTAPVAAADVPAPLGDYLGASLDDLKWRNVGGGVRQIVIDTEGSGKARLLRVAGGVTLPDHGHRGSEITMVLRGAYTDDGGTYRAGDVECADDALSHSLVTEPGEECICLTATEAPLRFKGWLPRLMQPILGI